MSDNDHCARPGIVEPGGYLRLEFVVDGVDLGIVAGLPDVEKIVGNYDVCSLAGEPSVNRGREHASSAVRHEITNAGSIGENPGIAELTKPGRAHDLSDRECYLLRKRLSVRHDNDALGWIAGKDPSDHGD